MAEPHSFIESPHSNVCLQCGEPHDHPNHSESW
jgi:hypothetical protein